MNIPNKKSLYNKSSITEAILPNAGQYGITIIATLGKGKNATQVPIKGILKEAISFGVEANWETLPLDSIIQSIMGSNPILGAFDTFIDIANLTAGSSFTNTGIFSKLFYKNSGRLDIAPNFRVFDYDGSGICTQVATVLAALCIPTVGESIPLQETAKNVKELKNAVIKTAIDIDKAPAPIQRENQIIDRGIDTIGESQANWSDSPNPISIKLGQWLTIKEAVITSVHTSFSYECTDNGPLYVDVALRVRTIENLSIDKSGNLQQVRIGKSNSTRVSITGSNRVFVPTP